MTEQVLIEAETDLFSLKQVLIEAERKVTVLPTPKNPNTPATCWQDLADTMVFRHPDPGVTVTTRHYYGFWRFSIVGVRDTRDPTKKMPDRFNHTFRVPDWHSERQGQIFLLGCWLAYIMHETAELVLKSKQEVLYSRCGQPGCCEEVITQRVVDPHEAHNGMQDSTHLQHWLDPRSYAQMNQLVLGRNELELRSEQHYRYNNVTGTWDG